MAETKVPHIPEGSPENPMATDGFEFVEYTAPDVLELEQLFLSMGFVFGWVPCAATAKR